MIRFEPFWPTAVAATLCFLIGGLWFSPLLFGKAWMKELHVDREPSRAVGALLAIPATIAAAVGLGVLTASAHATDVPTALAVAGTVWISFIVGIELPALYLENAPRRFAIGAGHKLVVLTTMAIVYGLWQ